MAKIPAIGRRRSAAARLLLVALCAAPGAAAAQDIFADAVHEFVPGTNHCTGADQLPGIVLGPPHGGGVLQGSIDVLALGIGGSAVLRFDLPVICDRPGADFTVFENAFHSGSLAGPLFVEYGYVAVSQDGETFFEFPFDAESGAGLAGQTPVESHPDNDIDPADPETSGGDAFDLAAVGLAWAAYVRITDVGGAIADFGDLPQFRIAPNAGFDLDAIAAVHACDPDELPVATATPSPTPPGTAAPDTPTATQSPALPTDTATPLPGEPTATPPSTATPSQTAAVAGDLDGDARVTAADAAHLIGELFDGDGDSSALVGGGAVASGPAADVNGDARVGAADLAALTARRME